MALKDTHFKFNEMQQAVVCDISLDRFSPNSDWEGTLGEFLEEHDHESEGVPYWNTIWLAMQFFFPKYRRILAQKAIKAAASKEGINLHLVNETLDFLGTDPVDKIKMNDLVSRIGAYLIGFKEKPKKEKKSPEQRIVEACGEAVHPNTLKHCPIALLKVMPILGKDVEKAMTLDVLNIHS